MLNVIFYLRNKVTFGELIFPEYEFLNFSLNEKLPISKLALCSELGTVAHYGPQVSF